MSGIGKRAGEGETGARTRGRIRPTERGFDELYSHYYRERDLMSWQFTISTGQLSHNGMPVATGYSGRGTGRNNPAFCNAQMGTLGPGNFGPVPMGKYTIGPAEDSRKLGPIAMPLTPDPANEMFGRSAFFIHA